MAYILKGNLCGLLCDDCREPLSGLTVRLYRSRHVERLAAAASASAKETFTFVSDREVSEKESRILGEATIDDAGDFVVEIADTSYNGGAFDIDVYCGTVPHLPPRHTPPAPVQLSITTLSPQWREREDERVAAWRYCIPSRYWCAVRARFGAWMICGRVVTCEGGEPIAGVIVSAFDADWLQDDALGSATTDGSGRFRIDYVSADFKKTPFPGIAIELTPGPDLYFTITTGGGDVLLAEHQIDGRTPDRENVGHCFCVELCLEQPPTVAHAWFTHVGDFDIYADINGASDGKTLHAAPLGFGSHGGPGYGFYDGVSGFGLKLVGDCPTNHPSGGEPMRYRFLTGAPGATLAALTPITAGQISTVQVGTRAIPWIDPIGNPTTAFQSICVAPSVPAGATPAGPPPPPPPIYAPVPPEYLVPDANGWVTVDPSANLHGFSGPLMRFVSSTVVPGGAAPGSGAGNPPADPKNGSLLQVVFQAEPVSGPTALSPTLSNGLDRILINNWSAVNQLDIGEFLGSPESCCTPLTTSLHILYSADHELMRQWAVTTGSCASIGTLTTPLPSGTVARGSAGTVFEDISNPADWPSCSYRLYLSTSRALTDGEADDPGTTSEVSFCIDR